MQYRRGWNGTTQIFQEEDGNTARAIENNYKEETHEKVLQVECFRSRRMDPDVIRREQEKERRRKEVELIRLMLQAVLLMGIFIMICFMDAADLRQTALLMTLILGCSAVLLIFGDEKRR